MKKLFLIQILFLSLKISAQITGLPSSSSFQSTRYSNSAVNETSGRVTASIPIYNYQVGRIQIPISLGYVGNGVKVSQQSNWVGTNWSLESGGVITRIVNSYPDEKASSRIFLNDLQALGTQFDPYNYVPNSSETYPENNNFVGENTTDYRVDLFNFSFGGYSGNFYLDKDFIPRLTNNDAELKIEFLGGLNSSNDNTILITTPNGVKYYFGGIDASERSSTLIKFGKNGNWHNDNRFTQNISPLATTSFYLYKIENSYDDEVLIEYYDDGIKNFVLFEQQQRSNFIGNYNEGCFALSNFNDILSSVFYGSIHNSKKIKRIYAVNSNLEVRFNSENLFLPNVQFGPNSEFLTMPSPSYNDRILKSIQVFDTHILQNKKNIVLDYLQPLANNTLKNRFFLERVGINNIDDILGIKCEVYKMEYNHPEDLPTRFSYDVDMLGYFNGGQNTNLIPQGEDVVFDGVFQNLAIRTPNLEYALKGALTKIYYPTGGYTAFEYEQPQVRVSTEQRKELYTYRNINGRIPFSKTTDSFSMGAELTLDGDIETPILTVPQDQSLSVNMKVDVSSGTSHHMNRVIIEVKDLTTNVVQSEYRQLTYNSWHYNDNYTFQLLKDHIYSVTLKQDPINPSSGENSLEAYAICNFTGQEFMPALGIRVKKITDFTDNQSMNIKRYHYKHVKDIGTNTDNSAVITYEPRIDKNKEEYRCIDLSSESFQAVTLIANPFGNIFAQADNQVEYRAVTISYGGDNFEEGGIEKIFKVEKREKPVNFYKEGFYVNEDLTEFGSCNLNNFDGLNGTLLKESVLQKIDGSLFFKNVLAYNYSLIVDQEIKNLIVVTTFNGTIQTSNWLLYTAPSFWNYSNYSFRNKLMSTSSKEYVIPVPITNESSNSRAITNVTTYEYGSLRGLPKKVITIDSKGDKLVKEYKYPIPLDFSSLDLSLDYLEAYQTLYDQNQVASPIEIINKHSLINNTNEKIISKSRSLFFDDAGAVVLQKVQTAKADNVYKNSIEYSLYDQKRNLLELTQENLIKKSFIYGYNDERVIAEIGNCGYSQIPSVENIKILSNAVVDETSMLALQNALNQLRLDIPAAQVTTYVYNPFGQLSSVTDSRGRMVTSDYDDCQRLSTIKDHDGNILEEKSYNTPTN